MEQRFLKKENNSGLLLFFAGWGADEHLFNFSVAEGYDYLLCFDYRELAFDYTLLAGYRSIRLLAWSMGVWAAAQVFGGKTFPWERRIAVNGTPLPIDDHFGIPEAVFAGTLNNFSEATLVRFRRRMCGTAAEVKRFLAHEPYRSVESLHEELSVLQTMVRQSQESAFVWDEAVVGRNDKIFLPENQQRYWQGKAIVSMRDMEHYDDDFFAACIGGKEAIWTKD